MYASRLISLSQPHPHGLRLQIPIQRFTAEVAPEARCFEAAERRSGIVEVVAVDPHRTRPNGARGAMRLLMSLVQIPAARPYIERLASFTPSSKSLNVSTASTGPKISSRA